MSVFTNLPGCAQCYAESIVRRWWKKGWGEFPGYTAALLKLGTPVLVEDELQAVLRLSDRIAKGKADPAENKIFWNDMTDEFLDFWPDEFIDRCFAVRALTPNLIHQVLTKRADRMRDYLNNAVTRYRIADEIVGQIPKKRLYEIILGDKRHLLGETKSGRNFVAEWPLPNVHLGVSIEDQKNADERIPLLLETPAAVRWASVEPLLSDVDLSQLVVGYFKHERIGADFVSNSSNLRAADATPSAVVNAFSGDVKGRVEFDEKLCFTGQTVPTLSGIVIGGESGSGHREMPLESAVNLARQAHEAGVKVFFKQDSGPRPGMQGRVPDDVWSMKEWPEGKAVTVA